MSSQQITVSGNVVSDPELVFGQTGTARCTFTVAAQDRYRDGTGTYQDGETYFARCVAWGQIAERIANSIHRGDRVLVTGAFVSRSWDKDDGTKGYATDLRVEDCGASMRWAEVSVRRTARRTAAEPVADEASAWLSSTGPDKVPF